MKKWPVTLLFIVHWWKFSRITTPNQGRLEMSEQCVHSENPVTVGAEEGFRRSVTSLHQRYGSDLSKIPQV
jgi:hypothetical protein